MKPVKILAPALLGTAALVLSACGGPAAQPGNTTQTGGATGASTPGASAPAPSAGWDINEKPRADLAEGGTLRLSVTELMTNWNSAHTDGNQRDNSDMQAPLMPSYFKYDSGGKPVQDEDYLASFTDTMEGESQVITLKLNPTAVWGDGDPIDADDWIATVNALNGKNTEFLMASSEGWDQIKSIEAGADKFEVKVTFEKTYPDWKAILGGPMRAESVVDPATFNEGWTTLKNEWLSGPYKVESITNDILTLVQNDKWWGEKPLLEKITFKAIAADAVASAYANQEIDFLDVGPDPDGYARASATPNTTMRKAAGPNFRHFTFNSEAENLKDVNVRQAIAKALDRTIIAKSDLAGVDWDPTPLNNNIFLPSQPEYVDLGKETGIDYNVEESKKQLDAAGWTVGSDGIREKDGKKLIVKFAALTGVKASENEAIQAQNMLKEVGIQLDIVPTPTSDFSGGKLLQPGNFDIVAFSWIGTQYPLRGIDQIYGGSPESWGSNFARLVNPALNELIPQIATESDPAKRNELGKQAAKLIWESVHTLPLYQRPELVATNSKLANYGAFGLGSADWVNVGFEK